MGITPCDCIYNLHNHQRFLYEPPHDKTNKITCVPSEYSDQPGIGPVWSESLLSVWRNIGPLTTYWVHSEDSDKTADLSHPLGAHVILLVLFCGGSNALECDHLSLIMWAASWQNKQNGMCAQQRLRSAWASAQSDQSLCCVLNG